MTNSTDTKHITRGTQFTEEQLIEILTKFIPAGWEIFEVQGQGLKIRRPYNETEIAFNEDGYKYDMLFVKPIDTRYYLHMIGLGYTFHEDYFNF